MTLAPSPILGITLVEPDQTGKFDTINAMTTAIEGSAQDFVTHNLSSGNVVVSAADFTGYNLHKSTGNSTSRVLTVPPTPRMFSVWNGGSAVLTVVVLHGQADIISAGKIKTYQSDGVKLRICAASDVGAALFTSLVDVDSEYTADANLSLRVNAGETAIDFAAAGTEKPTQIDKLTEYTTTTPPTPLVGLTGFIRARAFRKSMAFIDPRGHVSDIETALYRKNSQLLVGAGNIGNVEAAITLSDYALGFGGGTPSVSAKNVVPDGTHSYFDLQRRSQLTSSAGTGQQVRWVANELLFARGSVSGTGGFFAVFRFGIAKVQDDSKLFVGLGTDTGSIASTWASNTTGLGGCIGIIKDAADSTWSIIQKVSGSTAFTKIDTSFPAASELSDYYELRLFCGPCGVPYYSLERLTTGQLFAGQFTNSATLPTATAVLCPALRGMTSANVSEAVSIHFSRLYFENEISVI